MTLQTPAVKADISPRMISQQLLIEKHIRAAPESWALLRDFSDAAKSHFLMKVHAARVLSRNNGNYAVQPHCPPRFFNRFIKERTDSVPAGILRKVNGEIRRAAIGAALIVAVKISIAAHLFTAFGKEKRLLLRNSAHARRKSRHQERFLFKGDRCI